MTLLQLRTALGLYQTDMARRLDISYSHYEKLERGERNAGRHLQRMINKIAAEVAEGE